MSARRFDLVTVGRCMVDLYCDQVGAPIAQAQSLSMYTGGCPTNIAVGAARQGLRVAMLTRVGDDATGSFVIETLAREGIDTTWMRRDPSARTPMVIAGIEPPDRFPLTWYRERAADLEVDVEDCDEALIADAGAVLISGNSLSRPRGVRMARHLAEVCRRLGTRVVFDIDFRPALWFREDAAGHRHFVEPTEVAETLQSLLEHVDLLVGTEEEYAALLGREDAKAAFHAALDRIPGLAILKLGKVGAQIASRSKPVATMAGFPVRVLNTLGAGDAFMAGFLSAWLRDEPLDECMRRANASGALVVARHGCSPAMPYAAEIPHFLERTMPRGLSPQDDPVLERLHAVGGRPALPRPLFVLAIDHRTWFEAHDPESVRAFKRLAVTAVRDAMGAAGREPQLGYILDAQYAAGPLAERRAAGSWTAEPLEVAGAFPLRLMGPGGDPGLALRERPRGSAVKVLLVGTPEAHVQAAQEAVARQAMAACQAWGRELLLEMLAKDGDASRIPEYVAGLVEAGVRPDVWKLPLPEDDLVWQRTRAQVARDVGCRGVLFLGGGEPPNELSTRFTRVAADPLALGFAVGRTVFEGPFRRFLDGAAAVDVATEVAEGFMRLVEAWVP